MYARSLKHEHAEAKNDTKEINSFITMSCESIGSTVKNTATADDMPMVDFRYPTPLDIVLRASPTAFPTMGMKLAAANLTVRADKESLREVRIF